LHLTVLIALLNKIMTSLKMPRIDRKILKDRDKIVKDINAEVKNLSSGIK